MEIIANQQDFQLNNDTAVAIGKFDGIHIGHRCLLQEILKQKEKGLQACVFTFDPSPAVLFGNGDAKVLTTREEKRAIFQELGVDVLVEFPLTRESAATPPEVFVEKYLAECMRARFVAAGEDLSFGKKGLGNARLLQEMAPSLGMEVIIIPKVCAGGSEVSSTRIRSLLEQGEMEKAKELLGDCFQVSGRVQHGHRLGRTLGFPTVNLLPPQEKILPPFGVYYSKVRTAEREYTAISNVGRKPTVSGQEMVGVESYLYDFDGDLYDQEIQVALYAFRRPEQKFENLDALKAQLQQDIAAGAVYF